LKLSKCQWYTQSRR